MVVIEVVVVVEVAAVVGVVLVVIGGSDHHSSSSNRSSGSGRSSNSSLSVVFRNTDFSTLFFPVVLNAVKQYEMLTRRRNLSGSVDFKS